FVKKLTLTSTRMTRADADAVFGAGWDEAALHSAIAVCCLFNFMNRLVDGHGIEAGRAGFAERGRRHVEMGYVAQYEAAVGERRSLTERGHDRKNCILPNRPGRRSIFHPGAVPIKSRPRPSWRPRP